MRSSPLTSQQAEGPLGKPCDICVNRLFAGRLLTTYKVAHVPLQETFAKPYTYHEISGNGRRIVVKNGFGLNTSRKGLCRQINQSMDNTAAFSPAISDTIRGLTHEKDAGRHRC